MFEQLLTVAIEAVIAAAVGVGSYVGLQNGRLNAFQEQLKQLNLRVDSLWEFMIARDKATK